MMKDQGYGQIGTDVEEAAYFLAKRELVAIPTETVYGLAANAFEPNSANKPATRSSFSGDCLFIKFPLSL